MARTKLALGMLALITAIGTSPAAGPAYREVRLVSSGSSEGDKFGNAVCISGPAAAVTAPEETSVGGTTYVFVKDGDAWRQQQKITGVGYLYSYSGTSPVAIDAATLVIGTVVQAGQSQIGSAYVFTRTGTTWSQQQKVNPELGSIDDAFGSSVAIHGDTLVVGASSSNSAYVFVRSGSTWTEQQRLVPSDGGQYDQFGGSVDVHGDTIVVGSRFGTPNGAAYVFTRSGTVWTEEAKVFSAATGVEEFGRSVAVFGDTVIVGSPLDDAQGEDSGSAYVYRRDGTTWPLEERLLGSNADVGLGFGMSVAIEGETAVVGSLPGYLATTNAGAAHVFRRTGTDWAETTILRPAETARRRGFGRCVGISDSRIVAGTGAEDGGNSAGSAFVFEGSAGGGANTPPKFDLPPIAAPNPGVAGKSIRFGTAAGDADRGDRISYEWHFGDGTTANTKSKALAKKEYAAPGNYDVFVRATDRNGGTADSETTTVTVVAPGTPYFDVAKVAVALKFKKVGKDTIKVAGQFPLADGTALEGKVFTIDVLGVSHPFTLDAKGKSGKGAIAARVVAPKGGVAKFTVTLTGAFADLLALIGLENATVKNVDQETHVVVTFDGVSHAEDYVLVYSGKAGKSGAAK